MASVAIKAGHRGLVLLLLITLVVVVSAAVSQIWTRLEVIDYGYQLSRANREHARLQEINRRLRIEYALLKNPSHISRMARERLGMKPPTPEQIRRLRGPRKAPPGAPRRYKVAAHAASGGAR